VRWGEAQEAIRRVAARRSCPLRELCADFWFDTAPPKLPLARPTPCQVAVRTWRTDWGTLGLPLLGPHQAHNASVALAGLDVLAQEQPSLTVNREDVIRGFAALRWPARVEVVGQRPWLVIDGAHNVASADALAQTLRMCFPHTRRTLVFGTSRDKDLSGQLRTLLPLFDDVIATRYVENPRSVVPEMIAATVFDLTGRTIPATVDPADALELAHRRAAPDELICVTGSLFLAAEARAIVLRHENTPVPTGVAT
jgi:dihydrofolate synthase/folylpolyglutamate synthase